MSGLQNNLLTLQSSHSELPKCKTAILAPSSPHFNCIYGIFLLLLNIPRLRLLRLFQSWQMNLVPPPHQSYSQSPLIFPAHWFVFQSLLWQSSVSHSFYMFYPVTLVFFNFLNYIFYQACCNFCVSLSSTVSPSSALQSFI